MQNVPQESHPVTGAPMATEGYREITEDFEVTTKFPSSNGSFEEIKSKFRIVCSLPKTVTQPYPVILVPEDHCSGQIWEEKPDGGPGWKPNLLERGFQVITVTLPCVGQECLKDHAKLSVMVKRPDRAVMSKAFTAPSYDGAAPWSAAKTHTKWPGLGVSNDTVFEHFFRSLHPVKHTRNERQLLGQAAVVKILRQTHKKCIIIGHGTGATIGLLAADKEPDLVLSVVSIEPDGPPFGYPTLELETGKLVVQYNPAVRKYGLADVPVTCNVELDPMTPFDLEKVSFKDNSGEAILQIKGKGRKVKVLKNLAKAKHLIVTGHSGFHTTYDRATVDFMVQGGLTVDWIRLAEFGMAGNGHFMMLETNSSSILNLIHSWLADAHTMVSIPAGSRYDKVATSTMRHDSNCRTQQARVGGYKFTGEDVRSAVLKRTVEHTHSENSEASQEPKKRIKLTLHSNKETASQGAQRKIAVKQAARNVWTKDWTQRKIAAESTAHPSTALSSQATSAAVNNRSTQHVLLLPKSTVHNQHNPMQHNAPYGTPNPPSQAHQQHRGHQQNNAPQQYHSLHQNIQFPTGLFTSSVYNQFPAGLSTSSGSNQAPQGTIRQPQNAGSNQLLYPQVTTADAGLSQSASFYHASATQKTPSQQSDAQTTSQYTYLAQQAPSNQHKTSDQIQLTGFEMNAVDWTTENWNIDWGTQDVSHSNQFSEAAMSNFLSMDAVANMTGLVTEPQAAGVG
ncbi:hypothetical protein VHEMI03733 [[Torrubiella] hemipterigena]|uniref:AB hydrolase-1 domain-containing protein n=1 Tax=[Torrubiella] hemipterigena TaxID=1531966 RepID=A0A0A1SZC5_9HYPO|nr:hypothetical protein VHEMI03733 [[Torrubiella] hemipterigena]